MERCIDCLMCDTKPGVVLDEQNVCQACLHHEQRKDIDYEARQGELRSLCAGHKKSDGYDCIIPVSGGKDSHFQVLYMKKVLGMNPLLVSVSDPYTKTKAGIKNFNNIREHFGCDLVQLHLNPELVRRMTRIAFEEFGSPTWPIDRAIYCYPIKVSIDMNIPLVVYGENVSYEYGGVQNKETYSAAAQINNDVAKSFDRQWWMDRGISMQEFTPFVYPEGETEPIYLSYFMPWSGYENYQIAKEHGFTTLKGEWDRAGYIEDYDQIDSIGYLINVWMKYPKFGFARVTDMAGYWLRDGRISKFAAKKLIKENDFKLDSRILKDFLDFTGYTETMFYYVVDRFWNMELFDTTPGGWKPKFEV